MIRTANIVSLNHQFRRDLYDFCCVLEVSVFRKHSQKAACFFPQTNIAGNILIAKRNGEVFAFESIYKCMGVWFDLTQLFSFKKASVPGQCDFFESEYFN